MRYLLVADLVLAAFGAAMTIAVGFVALIFAIYRDHATKMDSSLPGVAIITGCFFTLTLFAGVAALLLRRNKPLHWLFQLLTIASIPYLYSIVILHLTNE